MPGARELEAAEALPASARYCISDACRTAVDWGVGVALVRALGRSGASAEVVQPVTGVSRGRSVLRRVRALAGQVTSGDEARRHGLVGPSHLWREKRAFQIEFLVAQGLAPEHRLVDIGCGTLRGGIPIIDLLETGHYVGIDARAEAIEEAGRELHTSGLDHKEPLLIASSRLADLELPHRADYVWAFSVLMHLDAEHLDECLRFVRKAVGPSGAFYANAIIGQEGRVGEWREFPVVRRPLQAYGEAAARSGLVAEDLGSLAELGHRLGQSWGDDQRMLVLRPVESR